MNYRNKSLRALLFQIFVMGALIGGFLAGWVINVIKLASMDGFSGLMLLRFAGVFFVPIGGVLGWVG